jgi:hypothetical protein
MKTALPVLLCSVLLTTFGCKSGNEASVAASDKNSKTETTSTMSPSSDTQTPGNRLTVSFISIGEGTDFRAKDSMDVFISSYQLENKKELKFEAVPWGREGEIDYCFMLSELSEKEQAKFIKALRDRLKFSELVQITENQPCKQRR